MFDFDPDYDQDKYRKAKFSEADEDRDNPTFIDWNMLSEIGIDKAHAELNNICERVKAGDRNSMLELIEITANEFLVFDTLPLKLRASLSDGLKEVGNVFRLSRGKKGFLPPLPPRGSGVPSEEEKRDREDQILLTARRVEYYRFHRLKLKDAEAKVAETMLGEARAKVIETMFSKGQTDAERLKLEDARAKVFNKKEALIHNHWKWAHRQAKPLFEVVAMVYDVVEEATGIHPDPTTRRNKKVR